MRVEHLTYFLCLAESGSTSQASEKLLTSRQNVSKMMQQLEEEMGTVLFIRSAKGMELTEAGLILQRAARKALEEIDEARKAITNLSNRTALTGELLLYGTTATSNTTLSTLLPAFRKAYPNITLHLQQHETLTALKAVSLHPESIGIVQLLTNEDFQFIYAPYLKAVTAMPIQNDAFVCLTSTASPLSKQKSISLSRFIQHPLVLNQGQPDEENCLLRLMRSLGEVEVSLTTTNPLLYAQPILSGSCIGISSTLLHNSYSAFSTTMAEIVSLPFRENMHAKICLVTANNARLSPAGEAFINFTKDYYTK